MNAKEKITTTQWAIDPTIPHFVLPAYRNPIWQMVFDRYGHLGTAVLLANSEYLLASRFFHINLERIFINMVERDHGISEKDYLEIITYCTKDLNLYDEKLLELNILFSIDLLRGCHHTGYFLNKPYNANGIIEVLNSKRGANEQPLSLIPELEMMISALSSKSTAEDEYDEDDAIELRRAAHSSRSLEEELPF